MRLTDIFSPLTDGTRGRMERGRLGAARLLKRVGRALGLGPATGEHVMAVEALEQRAMLEGSFATAILISLDGAGRGSSPGVINPASAPTDNDFYRFVAPANDFVRVLADTANEATTSTLNTRVSIYNDLQQLIASGSTNGALTTGIQRDGWAGFIAEAGRTYYVVVSSDYAGPAPNLTTGNTYTVRIAALSNTFLLAPDGSGIAIDPATPVPPPPLQPPVPGSLALRQEDQVWSYTAVATSLVTVNVQHNRYNPPFLPGSTIPNRLDTRVEIYNASGVLIASDSDAGRINDAFTSFMAQEGQTYYIRARSDEVRPRRVNDPTFDLTLATGPFWLVVDAIAQEVPLNQVTRRATLNGAFAGFDNPLAPSTLPTPVFQTANITFEAAGDGLAIITAVPTGLAPVTDPAIRLYNSAGQQIAFNDNFAGLAAQLSVRVIGGQHFFIVVDGFEINSRIQFILDLESNHTNNPSNGQFVDDHINTPALPQNPTPEQINAARRAFAQATGLTWSDPAPVLDANQNEIRDRGLRVTAVGTGRLHSADDTDLFQFTAPTDMLLDYPGNNDDQGTSLFIGGVFQAGSNNTPWLTRSRNLAVWDANDYWYTGAQYYDAVNDVTYGFNDNPDTPGTAGPEIYALYDYEPGFDILGPVPNGMTRRLLIVGGDFDLIIPTPFGPVTFKNLAVWFQNYQTGEFAWGSLGDTDGPVRAITSFTPEETVPELNDPGNDVPTNRPVLGGQALPYLVIGGDFLNVDGNLVNHVATWDGINGWQAISGPTGDGTDGPVYALAVYDPGDPGEERAEQTGPPFLPLVNDSRDIPVSLFIGGQFTDLGGTAVSNLGYWDGAFVDTVWGGPAGTTRGAAGPDGPVYALTVYSQGWDPDGETNPQAAPQDGLLIIGGQFTLINDGDGGTVATSNIAAWGFTGFGNVDQQDPNFDPRLGWTDLGGVSIDAANQNGDPIAVYALAEWDPPDINDGTIPPLLVIGGAFSAGGMENLVGFAVFDGAPAGFGWYNGSTGTNGIVRALTTLTDAQEPGIAVDLNSGVPQEVLYVGGDFTEVYNGDLADPVFANHVAQFAAFHDPLSGQDFFYFTALLGGMVNTVEGAPGPTVYALSGFDDGNPLRWDRHDRPDTTLAIVVSPAAASFANMRVRVYDSNLNIVFGFNEAGSETISPPFPDPAGMTDQSLTGPDLDTTFDGIKVWGGEVYYIEISALGGTDDNNPFVRGGTGRYTLTVIADAMATDLNGDDVLDDVNAVAQEEPDDGRFTQAIPITLPLGNGDNSNYVNASAPPLHGNFLRLQAINPSTQSENFPQGKQFLTSGDIGNISTIGDTDLYSFRAQFDGFVEIRISTSLILDEYGQDDGENFVGLTKFISSWLDSAIRVFRNDFEQIAYNDDNPAIRGEFVDLVFAGLDRDPGTPEADPFRFYSRDARVVIPVVAGNTYFVQVESGAMFDDGSPALPDDRVANLARETDVRRATGAYQLLINAMPEMLNDIENGQVVFDDHNDDQIPLATPVLFDASAGTASFSGVINHFPITNPIDTDLFSILTPGAGTMRIVVTRATGSNVLILATLFDNQGNLVADGVPLDNGGARIEVPVQRGDEYILRIAGTGNSEGAYVGTISGVPFVDDFANFAKLEDAHTLTLRDFLGLGTQNGTIEAAGDTDLFRFSFSNFFTSITFTVTALDATLDPTVTIYEISEDPAGNPMLLRVGFNDNASASTTTATVTTPITPDRAKAGPPSRDYPYYYVVVQGANPNADLGRYTLTLSFPATDDHPDATPEAVPAPTTVDTGEFSFATSVVVDSATGTGSSSGRIEIAGDTDLFKFTAPAGGLATIVVSRPGGSLLRARVFLTDATGNVLASGTGQDSLIFTTATASGTVLRNQTYFIVVEGYEDTGTPNVVTTTTGQYTISVTAPPIDDHPNAGEFSLATAVVLSPFTGVGQVGGSGANDPLNPRLSPTNDSDLFTFVSILAGTHTITVTPFLAGGNFAPRITVFDSTFTQVAQVSATSPLQEMSVTLTGVPQGTRFYVLVSAVSGVGATLTGEYRLRIVGPTPVTGGVDSSEIDFNSPIPITLNQRTGDGSRSDSINPSGDRDLFTFTTLAAGKVFIQVVTPSGSLLDASVRVLSAPAVDANGNGRFEDSELAAVTIAGGFDADGFPGVTAAVSFIASPGTQYWVVVDGLGDSVGSYEIRVNSQPVVNRLFFPEGFSNSNIREFLSIINPNPVAVNYTVYIRYEWDILQTVITSGVVAANSRDGLTIIDGSLYKTPGILDNVPYAVIVESDLPIGATLAHYDFGSAVGDSFTETLSATWNFARVQRDPGLARDFIVFYNPNNFDIDVTLTAYQNGQAVSVTRRFQALRRGGFAIDDLTQFPLGLFGVTLTAAAANPVNQGAFEGVVAGISHYSVTGDAAFFTLGTPVTSDSPQGGATHGVMTNIMHGAKVSSDIIFFNPGSTTASVTLTGAYVRIPGLPAFSRVFDIPAKSIFSITSAELGLVAEQPVGISWVSSIPITALASEQQFGDGDATQPATFAARQFYFGDAFINVADAGQLYFETLFFHNPTNTPSQVTIRLVFVDATESTFNIVIPARGYSEVKLHERPEIVQQRNGPQWFAVDVSGNLPFVATMQHYDLWLGGGWATTGVPFGPTNPLARVTS
jgi:hypothetical protein